MRNTIPQVGDPPLPTTFYDKVKQKGCAAWQFVARLLRFNQPKPASFEPEPTWAKWIGDDSPGLPWPWEMEADAMDQAAFRSIPDKPPALAPRSLAQTLDDRITRDRIIVHREVLADGAERIMWRNILP